MLEKLCQLVFQHDIFYDLMTLATNESSPALKLCFVSWTARVYIIIRTVSTLVRISKLVKDAIYNVQSIGYVLEIKLNNEFLMKLNWCLARTEVSLKFSILNDPRSIIQFFSFS